MNIVAIDDEFPALNLLLGAIKEAKPQADVNGFSDPDELLEFVKENPVDVACLDIQIYDITGIELAKEIKELQPRVNIIFVTAYGDYVGEAMKMHASGYLRKPVVAKDIEREFADLRYEISDENTYQIKVRCFGSFEVFYPNGDVLHFSRAKSKEAFAYLVCKNGSTSTISELGNILFEDEPYDDKKKNYVQKIISTMNKDLEAAGITDVVRKSYNSISIDPKFIDCDYYHYLNGETGPEATYRGEFMDQYSWAEYYNNFDFFE